MSTPVIGIDLGTTNSVVAYADESGQVTVITDENGERIIPSAVHFEQDGGIVVGQLAKDYAKVEPQRVATIFKRGMGTQTFLKNDVPFEVEGKTWTPEELSSLILKKLAGMASAHFGEEARRAVITVPYYFGDPERAATRSAGEIAGLEVLQVVNEPTAAAVVHGLDSKPEGELLVFDLGGGTFDVTIMRYGAGGEMEVVATSGDRELGGADFDAAILDRMIEVVEEENGQDLTEDPWVLSQATALAEEMKKELSTKSSSTRPLAVGGKPIMFTLSREEFEGLLTDQIQFVEDAVLNSLDKAEMSGDDIGDVLMVGGSSRMPVFQEMVKRITGREPQLTKNLDEDVARGAAMLGAKLGGGLDPRSELEKIPMPTDSASHAIGVSVLHPEDRTKLINLVLIPEQARVPYSNVYEFGAGSDGQTEVNLVINEGGDEDLDLVRELGNETGQLAAPVNRGHPITCKVEYDAEQRIVVSLYDGVTDQFITKVELEYRGRNLSEEAREEARNFLRGADVS